MESISREKLKWATVKLLLRAAPWYNSDSRILGYSEIQFLFYVKNIFLLLKIQIILCLTFDRDLENNYSPIILYL